MDKITRTLLLYSRLLQGEKINKMSFCLETDCIPRSFDRDIEDVRLYMSETFDAREVLYNRQEKVYYLSGASRIELESVEYLLIERVLLDTGVLRQDEMAGLLSHVLSNTKYKTRYLNAQERVLDTYQEADHKKALLKMHGDLVSIISNQVVIEIKYMIEEEAERNVKVIPCCLKYTKGYLYLIAFLADEIDTSPLRFRLDRIHSFRTERKQKQDEKRYISKFGREIQALVDIKEYK